MITKKLVEDNIIFQCISGSKAYGTDNPESDTDLRGICVIPNKSFYFGIGINKFEQMDKGWEDDKVIYDLRKALALMADANPNMLDLLFADESSVLISTQWWQQFIDIRELFLSKKVRHSYGGYAFAQLKRIRNHRGYLLNPPKSKPTREQFNLPIEKTLKADDIGAFQWLIAHFLKTSVEEMSLSDSAKEEFANLNYIGLTEAKLAQENISLKTWENIQKVTNASDEFIYYMMQEKAYINALNQWNSYKDWLSNRNTKRREIEEKFGYDTKHGMHLVRLMRMGIEILKEEKVLVKRPDAEELKEIRGGKWTYDQLVEYAENCDKELNELYKTTKLPNNPNRVIIDNMCQEVIENYLNKGANL